MTGRDPIDHLADRLHGIDAGHDDVSRARAEARLEAALDAAIAPPRSRRIPWLAIGLAGAAIAAAAVLVVASTRRAGTTPPAPGLALRPFVVAPVGDGPVSGEVPSLGEPGPSLEVPAGWLVRAALGGAATITVVGPSRVTVARDADAITVEVEGGRLLGWLDPAAGQVLRIRRGDTTVTVLGTVFAVDADLVTVLRGRVRVDAGDASTEVSAGQAWRRGAAAIAPLPSADAAELEAHARSAPPPEPSLPVTLTGAPAAADVWLGDRWLARTPAWVRLGAGAEVRVTAAGFADALVRVPSSPGQGGDARAVSFALATTPMPTPPPTPVEPPRPPPAAPRRASPPPTAAAPAITAEALYRDADRALASGDRDAARAALRAVVDRYPDDRRSDAARYELATLAHATGEHAAALRYLDAVTDPGLAEPVAYLRCRVLVDRSAPTAASCLVRYRRDHPGSVHDGDALALLAGVHYDAGDCAAARPLLEGYLARYPRGRAAAAARDRLDRCAGD